MSDNPNIPGRGTLAVHAGVEPDPTTGAIMTPVYLTSTYVQDGVGNHKGFEYSRTHNPTRSALQDAFAALEHGKHGFAFASGLAAMDTLLKTLKPGDEVISTNDLYGGSYRLFTTVFAHYGITFHFVDLSDLDAVQAALNEHTRLVWIETPTNPMMQITDIAAVANLVKGSEARVVVDNTFASPMLQNPLDLGADMVMHSVTKYLGGHSDILGGAVVGSKDLIAEIFQRKIHLGAAPDPHSCYLLERGMRTLDVRMPRICENAQTLAQRLEAHDAIERVYHSKLESHPDYEVAQRILPNGSGMIAFVVKGGDPAALAFMRKLNIIYEATSLGGVESLIECPFNSSHGAVPEDVRVAAGVVPGFVRLSIGIEDVEDLWADIEQALP